MRAHYKRYVHPSTKPIESFNSLYDLFYKTDVITQGFDAGFGPGALGGVDGTVDKGQRRKEGFAFKNLDAEAKVLAPLAISRVAALFLYFRRQVLVETNGK